MLTRHLLKDFQFAENKHNIETLLDENGTPHHPACFYLWYIKCIKHASDNTCYSQGNQIKQFLNHLIKYDIELKDVDSKDVQKYLYGYLFKIKKLEIATIIINAGHIKEFFGFCIERCFIEDRYIDYHVFLERNEQSGVKTYADMAMEIKELYMDKKDMKLLCEHVNGATPYIEYRNKLVLMLGYYAGLRSNDIASNPLLTVGKFRKYIPNTFEGTGSELPLTLSISYLNQKSSNSTSLEIGIELITAIHDFLYHRDIKDSLDDDQALISKKDGSEMVDDKLGSRTYYDAVENLIQNSDFSEPEVAIWRRRHHHVSRKCFATNMVKWCREQGLPPSIVVRDYLGHSDFKTTLKHYIYADWLMNRHSNKEYLEFLKADETSLGRNYKNKYEAQL